MLQICSFTFKKRLSHFSKQLGTVACSQNSKPKEILHLLGTILTSGLTHISCTRGYLQPPSETAWLNYVFFNSFWQQWNSTGQTNKVSDFINTGTFNFQLGSIHCWSFQGICWQKEKYTKALASYLNLFIPVDTVHLTERLRNIVFHNIHNIGANQSHRSWVKQNSSFVFPACVVLQVMAVAPACLAPGVGLCPLWVTRGHTQTTRCASGRSVCPVATGSTFASPSWT